MLSKGKWVITAIIFFGLTLNMLGSENQRIGEQSFAIHFTDEFKKVSAKELTPPVIDELLKQYPTSKLAAVYRNDSGEFKLIMVLQSGTRRTVYIDSYGNWFKRT
jgi:hypothetical protein